MNNWTNNMDFHNVIKKILSFLKELILFLIILLNFDFFKKNIKNEQ